MDRVRVGRIIVWVLLCVSASGWRWKETILIDRFYIGQEVGEVKKIVGAGKWKELFFQEVGGERWYERVTVGTYRLLGMKGRMFFEFCQGKLCSVFFVPEDLKEFLKRLKDKEGMVLDIEGKEVVDGLLKMVGVSEMKTGLGREKGVLFHQKWCRLYDEVKKDGHFVEYYLKGGKKREWWVKDGVPVLAEEWYRNGKKKRELNWKEGVGRYWNEKGELIDVTEGRKGEMEIMEFYEDGRRKRKVYMRGKEENGLCIEYDKEGRVKRIRRIRGGCVVKVEYERKEVKEKDEKQDKR